MAVLTVCICSRGALHMELPAPSSASICHGGQRLTPHCRLRPPVGRDSDFLAADLPRGHLADPRIPGCSPLITRTRSPTERAQSTDVCRADLGPAMGGWVGGEPYMPGAISLLGLAHRGRKKESHFSHWWWQFLLQLSLPWGQRDPFGL